MICIPRFLPAETILIATEEIVDGKPVPLPAPVKEGLYDGLFGLAHIVFDTGDASPTPTPIDLIRIARAGGARKAVIVRSRTTWKSQNEQTKRMIEIAVVYVLYDVETGNQIMKREWTEDDAGKKTPRDFRKIGFDAGRAVAEEIDQRLLQKQ